MVEYISKFKEGLNINNSVNKMYADKFKSLKMWTNNKNTEDLNNNINLLDLHNMYKTLYSTTTEHILFKYTQNCILG